MSKRRRTVVSSAKDLQCGDHIFWPISAKETHCGNVRWRHHAIVVAWKGDNTIKIIHVTTRKNEQSYEVREHCLNFYYHINEGKLWRYDYDPQDVYEPDEVIARARSKLGHFSYNKILNNCRHFVLWCKFMVNKPFQRLKSTMTTIDLNDISVELPKKQIRFC